jgi:hypothetical protein
MVVVVSRLVLMEAAAAVNLERAEALALAAGVAAVQLLHTSQGLLPETLLQ